MGRSGSSQLNESDNDDDDDYKKEEAGVEAIQNKKRIFFIIIIAVIVLPLLAITTITIVWSMVAVYSKVQCEIKKSELQVER